MNIVIGSFVIIFAVILRGIYKVKGVVSERIFKMCVGIGVFMLFSVQTFGNALLIAMTVAEILLCVLLLAVYRAQLIREKAAVRRRKAVRHTARRTAVRVVPAQRREKAVAHAA